MTTTRYSIVPTLKSVAPVVAGQLYIGSVEVAVDLAGRNCYAKFYWYDDNYVFLSNSTLGTAVVSTGAFAWQELEIEAIAPAGAAFAGIVPEIQDPTGGDTCEFYVDEHKIIGTTLDSAGPQPWQPPRQITITLQPNVINEMQNPSFGDDTKPLWGWAESGPNTTIASNSSVSLHDGNSMEATTTGFLPTDLVGVLCCGAHTYSSTALWPGSESEKPPITTLLPDTNYTISAWVRPMVGYLPIRISFFDGFGEYRGSATPYTTYGLGYGGWQRVSVTMKTNLSNTGSGRISLGYFASDVLALQSPVNPETTGQSTWAPWATPPRGYEGMWLSTKAYVVGDVVSRGTYFATALVANTNVDPNTDTSHTTWSPFNLTQPDGDPFYILGTWQATSTYPGEQLGLGVEYPAGSGITYTMAAPSNVFGTAGTTPMEAHEFLVDEVMVQEGIGLTEFFDGDIPSPDYLWEGAQYDSRSFYYRNRRSGQERLERIITNYVPFGTPIQIVYAPGLVTNLWSS